MGFEGIDLYVADLEGQKKANVGKWGERKWRTAPHMRVGPVPGGKAGNERKTYLARAGLSGESAMDKLDAIVSGV